ncbi:DUF5009 domain-containing protein [Sediminitomix flava]|uniref:Uncharacterized protein DUF5009 n=1 Tax=Sediminitomix flava TaxID=379075 RepID=A0A315ZF73_SEDFL|nr:DUF5009 domain-containing protein [Sediminitomix flava]PWJ43810.1 uncharacterized protein DUF5009 [Sediminitomix flava]
MRKSDYSNARAIQAQKSPRALALDALRGVAILAMVFSGMIPHDVQLPSWMYHAQVGPPDFKFTPNIPGITWVDLVFPFFLFAMGAAIPLAMAKKIEQGQAKWKIVLQLVKRAGLLAFFAIYIQHFKPWALQSSPDTQTWLISLFAFVLVLPVFVKFPQLSEKQNRYLNYFSWAGAILALYFVPNLYEQTFSIGKSDIIIIVLANMAWAGGLIYLLTKENQLLRLGLMAFLLAFRLTQGVEESWNYELWRLTPASWFYTFYYLQYLYIIIPGTIVGDLIRTWVKESKLEQTNTGKSNQSYVVVIWGCSLIVLNLVGYKMRALELSALLNVLWCTGGYWLFRNPKDALQRFHYKMYQWTVYWILLGVSFEAFEGGIKKDSPTMSYYFLTTGLAIVSLIVLSEIIQKMNKERFFLPLIQIGQNPMVAYVGAAFIVVPILGLIGALPYLDSLKEYGAWIGVMRGVIITSLVGLVTIFFVKKKWFMKS